MAPPYTTRLAKSSSARKPPHSRKRSMGWAQRTGTSELLVENVIPGTILLEAEE